MAIYIKGIDMPKGCRDCRFEDWGNCIAIRPIRTTRHLSEEREVYCPLIEVPEPHGRLIDADEVGWAKYNPDAGYLTQYQQGWNDGVDRTLREIDDTPTAIEGSE